MLYYVYTSISNISLNLSCAQFSSFLLDSRLGMRLRCYITSETK